MNEKSILKSVSGEIHLPGDLIRFLPELRGADLRVAVAVATGHRTIATIAKATGVCQRACFGALRTLEARGSLCRQVARGRGAEYSLLGLEVSHCPQQRSDPERRLPNDLGETVKAVTGQVPEEEFLAELREFSGVNDEKLAECLTEMRRRGDRFRPGDRLLLAFVVDRLRGIR